MFCSFCLLSASRIWLRLSEVRNCLLHAFNVEMTPLSSSTCYVHADHVPSIFETGEVLGFSEGSAMQSPTLFLEVAGTAYPPLLY